jgi:hypothetical protein
MAAAHVFSSKVTKSIHPTASSKAILLVLSYSPWPYTLLPGSLLRKGQARMERKPWTWFSSTWTTDLFAEVRRLSRKLS